VPLAGLSAILQKLCATNWFIAGMTARRIGFNASNGAYIPFLPMARYLDDTQRNSLVRLGTSWTWRTEWPTWALIVTIYGGWFGVASHARSLGLPLTAALLGLSSTW
jgi:hypothetical protein